ncbi:MAG: hypothetical protein WDN04_14360 [Rhodospirillales bacterium]
MEPAAGLLGFTSAHYATSGQTREQLEQAGYDRLLGHLRQHLVPAYLTAMLDDGAKWTPATADAAALECKSLSAVVTAEPA